MTMTPNELIRATMRGERSGLKPVFAPYENFVRPGADCDRLLKRGMAICRRIYFADILYPNIKFTENKTFEGAYEVTTTQAITSKGVLTSVTKKNDATTYTAEHYVKDENDFAAYEALLEDAVIVPRYDYFEGSGKEPYYYVRSWIAYEPLQEIIISAMGLETFCYLWIQEREGVMRLYDRVNAFNRKLYPLAAKCPVQDVNYGGNVVPSIISDKTFRELYLPCYREAADALHKSGKLLGCHLDADNRCILKSIGESALDYVEAYDTGCSPPLSEAVKTAPDKVFWVNFPSAVHTLGNKTIYDTAIQILEDGKKAKGLIIGVTEDLPWEHWVRSYNVIMDAIDDYYR